MSYQLKIKTKELAAESRANKLECRKMIARARAVTEKQLHSIVRRCDAAAVKLAQIKANPNASRSDLDGQYMVCVRLRNQRDYLEAKAKKWKPTPEVQAQLRRDASNCYRHRIDVVKPALRATNIAHGYLLGRSYFEMEGKDLADPKVNWPEVARMVYKYGSPKARDNFKSWLNQLGLDVEAVPVQGKSANQFYTYRVRPMLKLAA